MHISGEIQRDCLMLGLSLPHYLVLFMGGTTPGGRSELLSCFLQLILNFLGDSVLMCTSAKAPGGWGATNIPLRLTTSRMHGASKGLTPPFPPSISVCQPACLSYLFVCLPI